jgi:hypothetical protein
MTRCADAVWVGVSIGSEILVYKAPNRAPEDRSVV